MKLPQYRLLKISLDKKGTSIVAEWVDFVTCGECKHRPIKEDVDGENYGFNLIEPNDGDGRCPCLVDDGWYSWLPKDSFYCGYGEREGE